jgi:hypothetical protein
MSREIDETGQGGVGVLITEAGSAPAVTHQAPSTPLFKFSRSHGQRLRAMYRSAGWPCQDLLEVSLRAKPAEDWLVVRPDVFSIRNTTVEDYVEPVVHEIKVTRADLLGDLKKPEKRGGYMAVSSAFYFVLAEGIAAPEEVPCDCGVIVARGNGVLELVRPSPRRAMRLGFDVWIALAKANRFPRPEAATTWL